MKVSIPALALLSLLATSAAAQDKLTGTFSLDDESCKGLAKGKHCAIALEIGGDAAKALFESMKAKGVHEECTGGTEKSDSSGLHCKKASDGSYSCDFGYDFKTQAFGGSGIDC